MDFINKDEERGSDPQENSTPYVFSPFSADWVLEFSAENSHPAEPEEEMREPMIRKFAGPERDNSKTQTPIGPVSTTLTRL